MNKRLLILGAGEEQVPAYEFARRMGVKVVGLDMNPDAPGLRLTEERIIASTRDAESALRAAKDFHRGHPIDGVMTIAHDVPVTVAMIAEALGLPGIPVASARLAANKLLQIRAFKEFGVPVPNYREITTLDELRATIAEWGYPVVIKPLDNRGARGVLRLTEKIDTEWAFKESIAQSGCGTILVEEFIPGYQVSSETLVVDGRCYTAMYSGRNYEFLERFTPYIIENGGWLPGDITAEQKWAMDIVVQQVADCLGVRNGPIKGDLVLSPHGVVVLEFAARLGGGYACSHSIPATHGVNLVEELIKMSVGLPVDTGDLVPRYRQSAAIRFFFPNPGIIKEIRGFDELDRNDWLLLKRMYAKAGDRVDKVTDHTKRAGCVITVGKDLKEAEARAEKAIQSVAIITE